jgi:2,5-diketo-D-gluconate reductase A
METRRLDSGAEMPVLGLGVWQLAHGRETEQAVEWAFEAGYRHIDTAMAYRNEERVGAAIRRSGLAREDMFVTTKILPIRRNATKELELSLRKLGLDYVDLYLIHWPLPAGNTSLWHALESLRERGFARDIGVSNFGRRRLESLLPRAERRPAVNQVEFNPFRYRQALLEYCREHDVVFEAYSPLARGKGLDDPAIVAVAERIDRTPAQVVLRWAVQHGAIVIPKSSRQERIRENARIFDFELSGEDMDALDALDRTSGTANARF